jgi:hypothetical protein
MLWERPGMAIFEKRIKQQENSCLSIMAVSGKTGMAVFYSG